MEVNAPPPRSRRFPIIAHVSIPLAGCSIMGVLTITLYSSTNGPFATNSATEHLTSKSLWAYAARRVTYPCTGCARLNSEPRPHPPTSAPPIIACSESPTGQSPLTRHQVRHPHQVVGRSHKVPSQSRPLYSPIPCPSESSHRLCAVSHDPGYPAQPGRTRRRFLGQPTPPQSESLGGK